MSDDRTPGFLARFLLAWTAGFRLLFDAEYAARVQRAAEALPSLPEATPPKRDTAAAPPKEVLREVVLREATPDAALQLLSLLQRNGRFVDFLEEDVSSFTDAQIGAAARVVHEGCRKTLREHVPMEAIRAEDEGTKVTLEAGFDATAVRITGNVAGSAPYRGVLAHKGWRAKEVSLPKRTEGHDARVICPAEVELA